jgi:hypothetical protein
MLKRSIERAGSSGTTIIESSSKPARALAAFCKSWVYPSFQSLTRLCRHSMNRSCEARQTVVKVAEKLTAQAVTEGPTAGGQPLDGGRGGAAYWTN